MDKRTAHRWPLLLTITALIFSALGSFWLVQVMQRGDGQVDPAAAGNEPDYIVEKFSFVRMTPEGKPRYLFYGAKLTHRPLGDVSDVEQPMLQSLAPGQSPMTVKANSARLRHADDQVDLLGKVDVFRPASPMARLMHMTTEALTVFPEEDRMESRVRVDMALGANTITGVGMKANNATRQVQFAGGGQIIVPPKGSRK
ncbi:LPS export ABC transporter periplasmic protein LptC [Massilia sp. TSP1-1-2]|uniref:LPS export ABC transporter periplasmic protein LptC n=1 Tax=Massilia sp. TSP1-1-2 TaxID=2804649 RepID=UPI003CE8A246